MELKELGRAVDDLYWIRQKRLELQKDVDELKATEVKMRLMIRDTLETAGVAKVTGQIATAGITVSMQPVVEDWDHVYGFIAKTGKFELLQKRIGVEAWRELYKDGIEVPGVSPNEVVDISLTKSSRG